MVREFLKKRLVEASISRIQIERAARKVNITIHTARPGIVIGKKGEDIEKLRGQVAKMMKMPATDVRINIAEIRKPELDAQLVAEGIAQQLERRVMFRRAMKRAVTNTMRIGALGIKVRVSGRLNGAEIARTELYREGRVPLHTFRADIDYGLAEAKTTYGVIGVKVWIFKGEVFAQPEQPRRRRKARKASGAALRRPRRRPEGSPIMMQPKRTKYRKQFKGKNAGLAQSGNYVAFGDYGLKATSARAHDGARARSGASCDDALREARRPDLGARVPGRADHEEAAGSPHGQRQGQRRVLHRARSSPARCCSRWKA